MKKYLLSLTAIMLTTISFAQEKKDWVEITANIESNHLWRGLVVSDKPVITAQTIFKLDEKGRLTSGIWGGMGISSEDNGTHYREIDYYIQYANKGFSVGLWDLYDCSATGEMGDIWNYKQRTTGHVLDFRTSYYWGESLPLTLEADFLLYGAADTKVKDTNVSQKYSTYLQLSYNFINTSVNFKPFLGAAFAINGDEDMKSYDFYGSGNKNFEVVSVGFVASKKIKISEYYDLPVSVTTMWNPAKKNARVQLTATLF